MNGKQAHAKRDHGGNRRSKGKTPTIQQSLEDRIDRPVRAGWANLSSGGRVKRPLPGCP